MPYRCEKDMLWGPGANPVQLRGGDEVPAPVKKVLLDIKHVVEVKLHSEITGKLWADQPVEAQKAWAECNGQSYLHEKQADGTEKTVAVKVHPSQLVGAEEVTPPGPPKSQEAAGALLDGGESLAPPDKPRKTKKTIKKKRRGKPPRK
jgi:hypothetical protein